MSNKLQFLSSSTFLTFVTSVLVMALVIVSALLFLARPNVEAAEPVTMTTYQPKEVRNAEASVVADDSLVEVGDEAQPKAIAMAQSQDLAIAAPAEAASVSHQSGPSTYSGDVQADQKVPIAVEVIGQVLILNVAVGDQVEAGDVLLQIDSTTLEAQRAQAVASLQAAQAQLDGLLREAEQSDINAARAAVAAAQAAYQRTIDGPTPEDLEIAEAQLRQAEAAVKQAQAAYDQVAWNPTIAALPQSAQLEQATLQVEAARAQYEKITQGATADVVSGAYAQVVSAQAQLDRLLKGATEPQIAAVAAQVQQAETALYLAQLQVDKATVRAPVDGIVSQVNTAVGANVAPGAPVFQLLSNEVKVVIAVEESRLAQIAIGDPVSIRVNAYPDQTFDGEIVTIAPELNTTTRAVDVTIRPTSDATRLAPGMFATVTLR